MLSVFAAPGYLPEIHELEALIIHMALSPLVCSQAPQERLLATSLLHVSRTTRAEQITLSRPFHRPLVTPSQTDPRGLVPLTPSPSLTHAAEPAVNALPGSVCHTNPWINIYPCPCPTFRWLHSSTAISSIGSDYHPLPSHPFC